MKTETMLIIMTIGFAVLAVLNMITLKMWRGTIDTWRDCCNECWKSRNEFLQEMDNLVAQQEEDRK